VIGYAVERGASVGLIGDDQQLAAIGAGGVLRDIAATHGVLRLEELVRFSDHTEAEASIDLRDGDSRSLGFYRDHDRVHVGDAVTCADSVFEGWARERADGRDCLMLAPTRDLVRELNLRAQAARGPAGAWARLSDDCEARVGDIVITRRNDRRLGVSGTDWVKNGDRWIVTGIDDGALSVRHRDSGLHATLPATYVAAHVELGYAATVHTAQGLTADVMHGIVTGTETRQTLCTMLTRGRADGVIIAGESATRLHDIGDFWASRHDFVAPTRRQSQRQEIRFRHRTLEAHDIIIVEGLPVMTRERTIADLVEDLKDLTESPRVRAPALADALPQRGNREHRKHDVGSSGLPSRNPH